MEISVSQVRRGDRDRECLNYASDPAGRERGLVALLRRILSALRPGGLLVFDIATPGRGAGPAVRFRSGEDWAVVAIVEENRRRRTLVRRITTFRKIGRWWRRGDETHRVRLYEAARVAACLCEAGFQVEGAADMDARRSVPAWRCLSPAKGRKRIDFGRRAA